MLSYPPVTSTLPLASNVAVCPQRPMLRLPVLPNVNGAASELEARKTAEIDSMAIERATWRAQPRVKLFCCFFIDVFPWVMFVFWHLFPEIRDEVPGNFQKD